MFRKIPSNEEIQKMISLNAPFLEKGTIEYLQKLARIIKVQRRKIRYAEHISKKSTIHKSANGLAAFYWLRFRRRLNWIDFKRTIHKDVKPMLQSMALHKSFTKGKSRLPKKRRKK
ncbi:MAG: hypothetical protein IPJ89_03025 [Candidatus Iainarchaeum archaeon]|uniref:Uncharacterized protein n=1 Tax=Candidatus Iainarchaeum sp. TaxID=3101447 RepID=A0A7T9DIR4_9ARCH|nr:MAG: hypothetical protein IPJ89_03025 [Candidatus Diapherotrites archaeon]